MECNEIWNVNICIVICFFNYKYNYKYKYKYNYDYNISRMSIVLELTCTCSFLGSIFQKKNSVHSSRPRTSLILPSRSLEDTNTKFLLVTLCEFSLLPLKKWPEPNKLHVNLPVEKHPGNN